MSKKYVSRKKYNPKVNYLKKNRKNFGIKRENSKKVVFLQKY